jgi:hypothetical protein
MHGDEAKVLFRRGISRSCECEDDSLLGPCAAARLHGSQGRIKGFVGHRHFSSLGRFGDSRSIVGTTVYSRLSGLMEGEGMHI